MVRANGTSNSPTISIHQIKDILITLGGPAGGLVTLGADSVTFTERGLTVTGGAPGPSPVDATLSCQGNVVFALAGKKEQHNGVDGTINVEAMGGALTIDAGDGTFTLTDSHPSTDIDATDEPCTGPSSHKSVQADLKNFVSQESALFFKGRNIVTKSVATDRDIIVPVIQIEGAADLPKDVTLGGRGIVTVEAGGPPLYRGNRRVRPANHFRRSYGPNFDRQLSNVSWNSWVYPSGRCQN